MLGVVFEETFNDRTLVDEKIAMPSLRDATQTATSSLRDATRTTIAQNY
ncbi:MAG: hypothetical protein RM347_024150 [Nostoc sp. ChiQUE02]|nr:hypothetical protein [Nostoc sp. ChiQUE02]MDZ8228501.1 hypothetical protein [Nostoc sp. ChiQUE02]